MKFNISTSENKLRKYQFISIVLLSILFTGACAADGTDLREAIRAKNFSALEISLQATEVAFQRHRLSEHDLLDTYKAFYEREDVLSGQMDAWVNERPGSYFAYMARGTYQRKLGEFKRGTSFIQHVPSGDVQYMQSQFGRAKVDLRKALALNPQSFLAVLNLMNVAMYEDDQQEADRLLGLGNKAYPGNLLIRARYLVHLEPRWGGSYEKMDEFVSASREAGASSEVIRFLSAIELDDKGYRFEEIGDVVSAKRYYGQAMTLAQSADQRFISTYLLHAETMCGKCR